MQVCRRFNNARRCLSSAQQCIQPRSNTHAKTELRTNAAPDKPRAAERRGGCRSGRARGNPEVQGTAAVLRLGQSKQVAFSGCEQPILFLKEHSSEQKLRGIRGFRSCMCRVHGCWQEALAVSLLLWSPPGEKSTSPRLSVVRNEQEPIHGKNQKLTKNKSPRRSYDRKENANDPCPADDAISEVTRAEKECPYKLTKWAGPRCYSPS